MASPRPDISIVLPCYRAAELARRSVERIDAFMQESGRTWETVVVDDGGGDFGPEPIGIAGTTTLIQLPENRGKGAAVREGMLAASGRVRIYTDVDLPYGLDHIPTIVHSIERLGYHLVIGDRTLPGSRYTEDLPLGRRVASALFTEFVGRLVTGGFHDTQCGLKGLRGDVATLIFRDLLLDRFAFDVELVYVALKHRADIRRIPVKLVANESSSVRLLRDSARGVIDVFRIKLHQLQGRYESPELAGVLAADRQLAARAAWAGWGPATQVTSATPWRG